MNGNGTVTGGPLNGPFIGKFFLSRTVHVYNVCVCSALLTLGARACVCVCVCICLSVCLSVTTLAATSFLFTLKSRYVGICYRFLINSWIFEKTFHSKVMA